MCSGIIPVIRNEKYASKLQLYQEQLAVKHVDPTDQHR